MASKLPSQDFEDRVCELEARSRALTYVLACFVALSLFNLAVALWFMQRKSKPDYDYIAVTLTIFEVLLAFVLVGGFWMLRSAAEKAARGEARKVAENEAREVARVEAQEIARTTAEAEVRTTFLAWKNLLGEDSNFQSVQDMVASFGEDGDHESRD